jgi:hypothetical protein
MCAVFEGIEEVEQLESVRLIGANILPEMNMTSPMGSLHCLLTQYLGLVPKERNKSTK